MSNNVCITVLVENSVHRAGLFAENGLSFHIQIGPHSILFDTGQTDFAVRNANTLGVELRTLDAIVLSHGHYDHTGGVPAILAIAPKARVCAHPGVFEMKYSKRTEGEARFIGMSVTTSQAIRQSPCGFVETRGWTEILTGVFATGAIQRETDYEDTGGPFFLDAACTRPDPLTDDQAMVIDLGSSLIVLLGCAHAGVINTLYHVARMTGGKRVRAVIGGFHLCSASEERVEQTIAYLRAANLGCLAPLHCTGWPATGQLWQAFPKI
ncbi:MAG: MBL fold metallo-hydrolase [Verrucomicrobiota bacterium]